MSNLKIFVVEDDPLINKEVQELVHLGGYKTYDDSINVEIIQHFEAENQPNILLANLEKQHQINFNSNIPTIFFEYDKDSELHQRFKAVFVQHPVNMDLNHYLSQFNQQHQLKKNNIMMNDAFFVRNRNKLDKVNINDILWIQSDKKYCTIMTHSKKFVLRISLRGILEKLDNDQFIRVHRSYIVQRNAIESINVGEGEISIGTHKVPMGKKYQEDLFKQLNLL